MIASLIAIFFLTLILNSSHGGRIDGFVSRNSKVVGHHKEPSETFLRSWTNANGFDKQINTEHKQVRPSSLSQDAMEQLAGKNPPTPKVKTEQSLNSESQRGKFKIPLLKVETLKQINKAFRQGDESFQVNGEANRINDEVNQLKERLPQSMRENEKQSNFGDKSYEWDLEQAFARNSKMIQIASHSRDRSASINGNKKLKDVIGKSKNDNNMQLPILDTLDDIMMQEQDIIDFKQQSSCTKPKLDFCGDAVKYPITQVQMSIHSFYDGLAEAALDFITIQTRGQVRSCKKEIKEILCRDRFPRCNGQSVIWENLREKCGKAIASCPLKAQETLRNIDLCRKLGDGITSINECVPSIQSQYSEHCQLTKDNRIAPWDKHVSIEAQYLIEMQQTLFGITGTCLKSLYSFLCLPAKKCYSNANFSQLKSKFNKQCKSALKSCENSTLSKGMEVFFQCKQLQPTERD